MSELFPAAPKPASGLAHYKVLSSQAGVRVSPLCLGAANFGKSWAGVVGEISQETVFEILDTYYDAGGNFVDTADAYQLGESEQWIGEWMKKRKNREEMVIATKWTTGVHTDAKIKVNHVGNAKKNLRRAVAGSLKNLGTDYIDILYIHWWDYTTSIPELMQALNALVVSGQVLYLGISDTPAWIVSAANTYAAAHNLAPFVIYQGKWNFEERDFERDIIPMAKHFGMALAPWSIMGGGRYKKDEKPAREGGGFFHKTNNHEAAVVLLDKLASELNATRAQVCIAYVLKKYPQTFPILGGRKVAQLKENIEALEVVKRLTDQHIATLDDANPLDIGFPHNMVGNGDLSKNPFLASAGLLEKRF